MDISPNNDWIALGSANGYVKLVSNKSKQLISEFKVAQNPTCVRFSPDDKYLYSSGNNGQVYIWVCFKNIYNTVQDIRKKKPLNIFQDEGSMRTLAIDISNKYVATGSANGVVNVYKTDLVEQEQAPKPYHSILNLRTPSDLIKFNGDSQMLAIGSTAKEGAYRLVHIPSFSVFSNFPQDKQATSVTVSDFGFNPSSGLFAVAAARRVKLFRLAYYKMI